MSEIEDFQSQLAAYQNVIDDKAAQTIELRRENEALRVQLSQAGKGSFWGLGAILSKVSQKASCYHNIEKLKSSYESHIQKQYGEIEKPGKMLKEKEAYIQHLSMKFARQSWGSQQEGSSRIS
ncbi:hypothetical protein QBC36DRAFT_291003 [Triangularia setosa]|uniref:Uncharacterized protein n=1 Tax=Triangularia setosa TaxID=2587417 RepID=A0AAN6W625_9PEZI|nr:hypothetical protein QBC36DRAFT_291003 [Podospora setosa]